MFLYPKEAARKMGEGTDLDSDLWQGDRGTIFHQCSSDFEVAYIQGQTCELVSAVHLADTRHEGHFRGLVEYRLFHNDCEGS